MWPSFATQQTNRKSIYSFDFYQVFLKERRDLELVTHKNFFGICFFLIFFGKNLQIIISTMKIKHLFFGVKYHNVLLNRSEPTSNFFEFFKIFADSQGAVKIEKMISPNLFVWWVFFRNKGHESYRRIRENSDLVMQDLTAKLRNRRGSWDLHVPFLIRRFLGNQRFSIFIFLPALSPFPKVPIFETLNQKNYPQAFFQVFFKIVFIY